ncbi:MAG TPA: aroma-sacti cluster domain-containing protein [Micromonosporaceae bacterium]|nr:aroma-sacti cluster domain-containing protein [Micromonosporaceae bacterium]
MTYQSRLAQLGMDLQYATEEQAAVIESLSDEELDLLLKIKRRLDDAGGDVEGHSMEGGGVVW